MRNGTKSKGVVRSVGAALLIIGLGTTASAQAPLPQPQTQGDVTYLNGGAGEEEVQAIKAAMKDYSLALVFSRKGGDYVASIALTIKNAQGATIFEAPSVGPYLLVRLPAGRYSVIADFHGDTQVRPVLVATRAQAPVSFTWP